MNITREIKLRVGYKETDAMGIVHHSNYVTYCEMARTEIFRELGFTYKEMEQSGFMLPVRDVHICYFAPAFYDDLITVRLTLSQMSGAKLVFKHEMFNQEGVLLNNGQVILAFVNGQTRRPCHPPKEFTELIESLSE